MSFLWHFHSTVLQGFYASEIYVAAPTKEEAVKLAVEAYDEWLTDQLEDYLYHPLVPSFEPNEPEYEQLAAAKRIAFEAEAQLKMVEPCPNNRVLLRST